MHESRQIEEILNAGHFKKIGAKIEDYFRNEGGRETFLNYQMDDTPEKMMTSWKSAFRTSKEPGGMAAIILLYLANVQEITMFPSPEEQLDIFLILKELPKPNKARTPMHLTPSPIFASSISTPATNLPL